MYINDAAAVCEGVAKHYGPHIGVGIKCVCPYLGGGGT